MKWLAHFFFVVMWLIPLSASAQEKTSTVTSENFIVISDIHFDPFLSCDQTRPCRLIKQLQHLPASQWAGVFSKEKTAPYQYRRNTDFALLQSMLYSAKTVAKDNHASFVLVLGDNLSHNFRRQYKKYSHDYSRAGYRAFVRKTLQFISLQMKYSFKELSIYNAVGNNDSYHYDYTSYPGGAFFSDTAITWSKLIESSNGAVQMRRQFEEAGYYSQAISPKLKLIVLNSVLFSRKARGPDVALAANKQLSWLSTQLEDARDRKQKVLIAMHIPSTIDIYAHLNYRIWRLFDFWHQQDAVAFEKIINEFALEISAILVGHLHRDWFQVMTLGNKKSIPILGTPAVSPVYGNHPGFKLYRLDGKGFHFKDFDTYYLPKQSLNGWRSSMRVLRPANLYCKYSHQPFSVVGGSFAGILNSVQSSQSNAETFTRQWKILYQCRQLG